MSKVPINAFAIVDSKHVGTFPKLHAEDDSLESTIDTCLEKVAKRLAHMNLRMNLIMNLRSQ